MAVAGNSYGYFLVGEHRRAVAVLDRAMELVGHDPDVTAVGSVVCPYGSALIFKGGYLAALGELDETQALFERGIELCRERGDIETIGWAHMWWFWHCYHSGEPDAALAHAQQALDLSDRLGAAFSRIWSWTFFGGAQVLQGRWSEAIESLENALDMSRELQTSVESRSWAELWLAEAHAGLGEVERGVELARRALEEATARGLAYGETAGHLILARLLLAASGAEAAAEIESELATASEQSRRRNSARSRAGPGGARQPRAGARGSGGASQVPARSPRAIHRDRRHRPRRAHRRRAGAPELEKIRGCSLAGAEVALSKMFAGLDSVRADCYTGTCAFLTSGPARRRSRSVPRCWSSVSPRPARRRSRCSMRRAPSRLRR